MGTIGKVLEYFHIFLELIIEIEYFEGMGQWTYAET